MKAFLLLTLMADLAFADFDWAQALAKVPKADLLSRAKRITDEHTAQLKKNKIKGHENEFVYWTTLKMGLLEIEKYVKAKESCVTQKSALESYMGYKFGEPVPDTLRDLEFIRTQNCK